MPETTPKVPTVGEVRRQIEDLFGVALHAGRSHFAIVASDLDDESLYLFTCCEVQDPANAEARADVSQLLWDALMKLQDPGRPAVSFEAFLARYGAQVLEDHAESLRGENVPDGQ